MKPSTSTELPPETTEIPQTSERSTLGSSYSNNSMATNTSAPSTNLTRNIISPSESSTLQLDNAARERIFVILNRRLLNSLRNLQNDTNPNEQERNFYFFPQLSTNDSFSPNNLTIRDTVHDAQTVNVTVRPKRLKSKKVNVTKQSSPLGSILAQFLMQAIGVNNKYNPYNKTTGIAITKGPEQSGLKDLIKMWTQNRNQSSNHENLVDTEVNFNEVESSNVGDSSTSNERTLAKLSGLKLEESLNRRIERESNLLNL